LFETAPVSNIAITSTDCREYRLSNWNIGLISFPSVPMDLTFIDNGDNSLTIPRQSEEELTAPRDTIQGIGSINPQNGRISLNIELTLRIRQNTDTVVIYPVTLIPE
jgi:hypothetical protein